MESRMAIELMNAVLAHAARRVDPADYALFPSRGRAGDGNSYEG